MPIPKAKVGYRQPPIHSRFKKGHSANPRGRPKRPKTIEACLDQELRKTVMISENGKRTRVTKEQLIAVQIIEKARSGDAKALRFLIDRSNKKREKPESREFRFIIDGLDMTPKPPNKDDEE
jgi:hypothetical protein